jgi:tripeptide aminopeptidase
MGAESRTRPKIAAMPHDDVVSLFTELAAVPSPPGDERAVADVVAEYMRSLGLDVSEDDAGARIGSNAGNLYARVDATHGGTPLFLCAHLDTVPPEAGIVPVLEDGVIRNSAGTILGADNKSAVAVMLEATRRLLAENRPHAGLELLFTPMEEVGLYGAGAFDHERLRAHVGYVYDQAAPIGEVILGAPHSQSMNVKVHGRAAHAGMFPEEGRSAIAAAAKAIADFKLGRVDQDTTANVGLISGGTAGNIVPEWCTFLVDVRSHDQDKLADLVRELLEATTFAASLEDCQVETEVHKSYSGYRFKQDADAVRIASSALERSGFEPTFALSGGGADANVFNERGLACVNLANGMTDIHTPDERIAVSDLERMVDVTLALVDVARETDAA